MHVAGFAITDQSKELGSGKLGSAFIFDEGADDWNIALGGERLDLRLRPQRILFVSRGAQLSPSMRVSTTSLLWMVSLNEFI